MLNKKKENFLSDLNYLYPNQNLQKHFKKSGKHHLNSQIDVLSSCFSNKLEFKNNDRRCNKQTNINDTNVVNNLHELFKPISHGYYQGCTKNLSRGQKKLIEDRNSFSTCSQLNVTRQHNKSNDTFPDYLLSDTKSSQSSIKIECCVNVANVFHSQLNLMFLSFQNVTALILRQINLIEVPEKLCDLRHLVSLDLGENNLTTLSEGFKHLDGLRCLILDHNSISRPPQVLFYLFNLRYLDLNSNPLEPEWSFIYKDGSENNFQAMMMEIADRFTKKNTLPIPPKRSWKVLCPESKSHNSDTITVMSYNVLCPKYATYSQYPYCPTFAMDVNHRRSLIMREIFEYMPDIVALQELDLHQLNDHYSPQLIAKGYNREFVSKNRSHFENDHSALDGCAIFYKSDKFELIEQQKIRFNDMRLMLEEAQLHPENFSSRETVLNRLMPRDNTAILLFLLHKKSDQYICVSNGHLFWDPEFCDVKLVQSIMWTAMILQYMVRFYCNYVNRQHNFKFDDLFSTSDSGLFSPKVSTLEKGSNNKKPSSTIKKVPSPSANSSFQPESASLYSPTCRTKRVASYDLTGTMRAPEPRRSSSANSLDHRLLPSNINHSESSTGERSQNENDEILKLSETCSLNSLTPEMWEQVMSAIPVIVCGDFNSLPNSGPIQYMTGGKVNLQHEDFLTYSKGYGLEKLTLIKPLCNSDDSVLHHGLKLISAYSNEEDMRYTNFTNKFKGIIDYILYSERHFTVLKYLCGIPEKWFSADNQFYGCPNLHIPSDHFFLLTKLLLNSVDNSKCKK